MYYFNYSEIRNPNDIGILFRKYSIWLHLNKLYEMNYSRYMFFFSYLQ